MTIVKTNDKIAVALASAGLTFMFDLAVIVSCFSRLLRHFAALRLEHPRRLFNN
jgi:hypothetical protein